MINEVNNETSWKNLLAYYIDCLREENRLRYVIKQANIHKMCFFLAGLEGDFLRQELPSYSIRYNDARHVEKLHGFVLGDPHSGRRPSVAFGYPFFVDSQQQLMPLLYITVSGTRMEDGVGLVRESIEIEPNFAAIWEVMPGDKEIALDEIFQKFDAIGSQEDATRFDQLLALLRSQLEEHSGFPIRKIPANQFDARNLPSHALIDCPLLFHVSDQYTYQLLRELEQLCQWHHWEQVQPGLRQLLGRAERTPYPGAPDPATDPRLYPVPANNRQRQAILAASQCPITVITGPPGTGKSQLIVNIVGDAILRGESVLIASKNNRAVDVVSERFLGRIDYPGSVRTGKSEYRHRLPAQMQRVFAQVRSGGMRSQMEQVRAEHDALIEQIKGQRRVIADVTRLTHEREAYQVEVRDLMALLPEALGQSVGKVPIVLVKAEAARLIASVRALLEEVGELLTQREALVTEIRAVVEKNREGLCLLKELEALERQSGISMAKIRRGNRLADFSGVEQYLAVWEAIVEIIRLTHEIESLTHDVTEARAHVDNTNQGLPNDLAQQAASAAHHFALEQEQALRQSLNQLGSGAQDLAELCAPFFDAISSLLDRFGVARHMLNLLGGACAADSPLPEPDLALLGRLFAIQDQALEAHEVNRLHAGLRRKLSELEQEQRVKTEEFDSALAEIEAEIRLARAQVPAMLIADIEAASEHSTVKVWEKTSASLTGLDKWCDRVRIGELTLAERIRKAASRDWAIKHLTRVLDPLAPTLVELGIIQDQDWPPPDASLDVWSAFVHERASFATAAWLAARLRAMDQQRQVYKEQIQAEIATAASSLRQAETQLLGVVDGLPQVVVDSMLEGTWPVEPLDSELVQELSALGEQYSLIATRYDGVMALLKHLALEYVPCAYIKDMLRDLDLSDNDRRAGIAHQVSPRAVSELVTTWQQFSAAVEAEHKLRSAEQILQAAEARREEIHSRLPKPCMEMNLAAIPYSDELVEEAQAALASLREKLGACLNCWKDLEERTNALLHKNQLASKGLGKALARAKKDPAYLPGILEERNHQSPEQLADTLKLWLLVLQIWSTQSNLAAVSNRLSSQPRLEDAVVALNELLNKRQSLAGRVLKEQWKDIARKLDPDCVSSIDLYLDAIQALTGQVGSSYRLYKQQAVEHFVDALKLFPIWLTTNLSTQDLPLKAGVFDTVVIDEASQCDIPSALPLLFRAKKIVIIGDERQLRHIATLPNAIHSPLAERSSIGMRYSYREKSLFDLAVSSTAGTPGQIKLDEHYRSHPEIIQFANKHFYGFLKQRTDLSHIPAVFAARGCGVYWLNVKGVSERPAPGQIYNRQEAEAIESMLLPLIQSMSNLGMKTANVGIVTPFRAQADRIRKAVQRLGVPEEQVLVGTIHTYQGDERDIMILSTVATKDLPQNTFRFLADNPNLLNVAVTRARLSLIVVGDHDFYKALPEPSHYRKLAIYAEELGRVCDEVKALPIFQPLDPQERDWPEGPPATVRPDTPYSNRMTLRRLLALCQDYLWWYDPHMSTNALDALALALSSSDGRIGQVRLLTREDSWENPKENLCITKKAIQLLKRELAGRGIKLQLAVLSRNGDFAAPHDRFLFSADRAVNMPPVNTIHQEVAKLAEFLPSSVTADEFEIWWQKAKIVFQ